MLTIKSSLGKIDRATEEFNGRFDNLDLKLKKDLTSSPPVMIQHTTYIPNWWYKNKWYDDIRWWYDMMIREDNMRSWYKMMIWDDDMRWWY